MQALGVYEPLGSFSSQAQALTVCAQSKRLSWTRTAMSGCLIRNSNSWRVSRWSIINRERRTCFRPHGQAVRLVERECSDGASVEERRDELSRSIQQDVEPGTWFKPLSNAAADSNTNVSRPRLVPVETVPLRNRRLKAGILSRLKSTEGDAPSRGEWACLVNHQVGARSPSRR